MSKKKVSANNALTTLLNKQESLHVKTHNQHYVNFYWKPKNEALLLGN